MKTIPKNVETKMMAFNDSTATAPDKITGQKNIVAFRACGLKNDSDYHLESKPGISYTEYVILYQTFKMMHSLENNLLYS